MKPLNVVMKRRVNVIENIVTIQKQKNQNGILLMLILKSVSFPFLGEMRPGSRDI